MSIIVRLCIYCINQINVLLFYISYDSYALPEVHPGSSFSRVTPILITGSLLPIMATTRCHAVPQDATLDTRRVS